MRRRSLLAGLPGLAALAAAAPSRAAFRSPRLVVVGAGILGASVAYHLAGRGARVTVLDKGRPGGGATQGAFAMLIASHSDGPERLNAFYRTAVEDWRRLERELGPALPIQWGGALSWAEPGAKAEALAEETRRAQAWGSPLRLVDAAEAARLVPGVKPGPFGVGVFSPEQGTLDPQLATDVLVQAAKARGAVFRHPDAVTALVLQGGRVTGVETAGGRVEADTVVIAAGAGADVLAQQAGTQVPHGLVSGALAHSAPLPPILGRVLEGPDFSLKQNPDGRIVTGPSYRPGAKAEEPTPAYGETLIAKAAESVPAVAAARLQSMTLGYVPIPKDGAPIVGFGAGAEGVYVMLTMSGITFAPLLGKLAAAEILDGRPDPLLSPYTPARFG